MLLLIPGVFDHRTTQQQFFEEVARDIVQETLAGFNCTIFAYGQTGTGKTFTMEGKRQRQRAGSPFWYGDEAGLIPRVTQEIFQHLKKCASDYTVHVSYLELYNEELIDLLAEEPMQGAPNASLPAAPAKQLAIRWDETRKSKFLICEYSPNIASGFTRSYLSLVVRMC